MANQEGVRPRTFSRRSLFITAFERSVVPDESSTSRVSQYGSGAAPIVFTNIKAPKNGYVYVYIWNESDEMVCFDNLQVAHNRGRIIEENHYYSYGLKIAGISSRKIPDFNEGHIFNRYLYNDKELIDEGDLNWYDYSFINYDPQIGRFLQLDRQSILKKVVGIEEL